MALVTFVDGKSLRVSARYEDLVDRIKARPDGTWLETVPEAPYDPEPDAKVLIRLSNVKYIARG